MTWRADSTPDKESVTGSTETSSQASAVIGVPDEKWGERPKAFVLLKPGAVIDGADIIEHVRGRLAHFKAPDAVEVVTALPKTSTGKIQKFVLREREWAERDSRIN